MTVTLFDYGAGNLHSLAKALEAAGARVRVEADARALAEAEAVVLPGVGAFGAAAERLAPGADALRASLEAGQPCLGICLGMQLLFESSEEGDGAGLGVMPGTVRRLRTRRVPHMGWNRVTPTTPDPLLTGLDGLVVYYANSYYVEAMSSGGTIATSTHEDVVLAAAIRRHRTWGVQFHPEKSDVAGLRLIRNFLAAAEASQ